MAKTQNISIGQCWVSQAEPELGLGFIQKVDARTLSIAFPGSETTRNYAVSMAPLQRVAFAVGDQISSMDGKSMIIEEIIHDAGLMAYIGDEQCIVECDLSWQLRFNKPKQRLSNGQADPPSLYKLRQASLQARTQLVSSPVRGLMGPRVSVLGHQQYIARQISQRAMPRVLLADEVGLGKTIEAGIIMHQLIQTEQVTRTLVVVPEALVHQWFVEMYRKFDQSFGVLHQLDDVDDVRDVFASNQHWIVSLECLIQDPSIAVQALTAKWDLMVVDEAHRLDWTPKQASPAYTCIQKLAKVIPGIILLTATPEQLGMEGHFSRLALLDSNRFHDYKIFEKENQAYQSVAKVAQQLIQFEDTTDLQTMAKTLAPYINNLKASELKKPNTRAQVLQELLDLHGTGRILFRNARQSLESQGIGFPKRVARPMPLACDQPKQAQQLKQQWLLEFLQKHPAQKVLLIAHETTQIKKLHKFLSEYPFIKTAMFHQDLSLMERDRNAAYFSDEQGAQILLASEIGSEGRNFQFAHNLILFDLPKQPDVLEQRIGRLDRIGQTQDIQIHIPYIEQSHEQVWFQWYHDGLNAFQKQVRGGSTMLALFKEDLEKQTQSKKMDINALKKLIDETQNKYADIQHQIEQGKDKLLELNSYNHPQAQAWMQEIHSQDQSDALQTYLESAFEKLGIDQEVLSPTITRLTPGPGMKVSSFPGMSEDGLTITFDRATALAYEDIAWMNIDHPMVTGLMDMILGSTMGNVTIATWHTQPADKHPIIEAAYVLEVVANKKLNPYRYFPPTVIRVAMDGYGRNLSQTYPHAQLWNQLQKAKPSQLDQVKSIPATHMDQLLDACKKEANQSIQAIIQKQQKTLTQEIDTEIHRLKTLKEKNNLVRQEEINFFKEKKAELLDASNQASLRLDSFTFIVPYS